MTCSFLEGVPVPSIDPSRTCAYWASLWTSCRAPLWLDQAPGLNTNERAVGTMTDEWLLYQLCHVGQIWPSGKLIPCTYPPPGNIAKWRLLGIPYSKCTDPGGDCQWVGGLIQLIPFFSVPTCFFPMRNSMRPLLGLPSAAKACCPPNLMVQFPPCAFLWIGNAWLANLQCGTALTPMVKKKGCRERFAAVPWHQSRTLL